MTEGSSSKCPLEAVTKTDETLGSVFHLMALKFETDTFSTKQIQGSEVQYIRLTS